VLADLLDHSPCVGVEFGEGTGVVAVIGNPYMPAIRRHPSADRAAPAISLVTPIVEITQQKAMGYRRADFRGSCHCRVCLPADGKGVVT
jgi:hypothetical protein